MKILGNYNVIWDEYNLTGCFQTKDPKKLCDAINGALDCKDAAIADENGQVNVTFYGVSSGVESILESLEENALREEILSGHFDMCIDADQIVRFELLPKGWGTLPDKWIWQILIGEVTYFDPVTGYPWEY